MKRADRSRTHKRTRFLGVFVAVLLAAAPLMAGSQSGAASGTPLFWPAGSVVHYTFMPGTILPNNDNDLVRGAVKAALQTLMNALPQQNGQPAVQFVLDSTPASNNSVGCDGVNLVTFTDTNTQDALPPQVIAQAISQYSTQDYAGAVNGCGGHTFANGVRKGQIYEVDMIFNTSLAFSPNRVADDQGNVLFDIQAITLHEGAHWLGVGHTGVTSAAMSPFGDAGGMPLRELQSDDVATITGIYAPGGPAITGKVSGGSAAIQGAHVVAVDAGTGLTTASAFSDASGNYTIPGLTSGRQYKVFAEPLDGPISLSNIPMNGNSNFSAAFANNGSPITAPGSANITVTSGTPSTNLQNIGVVTPAGNGQYTASWGPYPLRLPRGVKSTIVLNGTGISKTSTVLPTSSSSKVTVAANTTLNFSDTSIKLVDVTIAADAPIGPTDLYIGGSSFSGGLVVAAKPQLDAVTESAAFNLDGSGPNYAPGSLITLWGSGFTDGALVINQNIPLATELAGVSVKIGNQLAPLFFVSAGQINAMIPFDLSSTQLSSGVDVVVSTGANAQSAPVHLTFGSTAPRIFMMNATKKTGAIIKLLNSAPWWVLADDTAALSAGDVLAIYCEGLGKATGANNMTPASGMAYNLAVNANDSTITVTIGGTTITPAYAGLAPTLAGCDQINIVVPSGIPSGLQTLTIKTSAGSSNTAMVLIK